MQGKRIALAIAVLALAIPATASARERPTFIEAHRAAHYVLDTYAQLLDGQLVVGPCRHIGSFTTVCRVRVAGPSASRYRVLVTGAPDDGYIVRARLTPKSAASQVARSN